MRNTQSTLSRRQFVVGIGLGVVSIGLGIRHSLSAEPQPLVFGLGTVPDYTHYYVADALNIWGANGLKASSTMFPAGRLALEALVAGRVQIATCSETPVVFAAANGLPIRVIASNIRYEPFDLVAGPKIASLDDLRGKKIAYAQGTNAHFYLDSLVKSKGMAWSDITAVNMQVGDFVPSVASGAVDGFVWSEPLISAATKQNPAIKRLRSPGLYYAYGCMVTTQAELEKSNGALVNAVRSLMRTDAIIKQDPEKAMAILAARLKLEPAAVKEIWSTLAFDVSLNRPLMIGDFEKEARWAAATNLVKGDVKAIDFKSIVVSEVFEKAKVS